MTGADGSDVPLTLAAYTDSVYVTSLTSPRTTHVVLVTTHVALFGFAMTT